MFTVKIPFDCLDCKTKYVMLWDPIRAKHEFKRIPDSTFGEKMCLIRHYKKLKGYDKLPNWDRIHRGRSMSAATKVLKFFAMLENGNDVAMECLDDINEQAKRENWPGGWSLDTVVKKSSDWLVKKQGSAK